MRLAEPPDRPESMPLSRSLRRAIACVAPLLACRATPAVPAPSAPVSVDVTWFSITNVRFRVDTLDVVADGYVTRLPGDVFGRDSTLATTTRPARPDSALVAR